AAACGGGDDTPKTSVGTTPSAAATGSTTATATVPKELTPQEIVAKLTGSVVHIKATYPAGTGGGSGIVWEDGTHILTNAHVVLGAGSIKVVDPVDQKQISARVVALSPCDDVALLEVERGNFKPASIGDSKKVATGEAVVTLGFPGTFTDSGSDKLTVTRGIVSKSGDSFDGLQDLIQTDAAINGGNSGGPLVNARGEVIGMNTLRSVSAQNANYAISMAEAKFVADKLKAGKNINYLGMRLEQNYQGLAQQLNVKLAYIDGLVVTGVDTGSPAAAASLGYSDLVYYLDNVSVESVGAFCDVLRSRKTGDKLRIDFTRTFSDGSAKDFFAEVTLQ
ncbi:MAG: trypsin-like peptidase domain-containing protein, partial [Anaerolineaceae bacterium]